MRREFRSGARELSSLGADRFDGFCTIAQLRHTSYSALPRRAGVYFIVWVSRGTPKFLRTGPEQRSKRKHPAPQPGELRRRWVPGAHTVYMRKAGRHESEVTLRSRLRAYLRFGEGRSAGHAGGRAIWQLADPERLLVAWMPTGRREPRAVEKVLLAAFEARFGALPFANRRR